MKLFESIISKWSQFFFFSENTGIYISRINLKKAELGGKNPLGRQFNTDEIKISGKIVKLEKETEFWWYMQINVFLVSCDGGTLYSTSRRISPFEFKWKTMTFKRKPDIEHQKRTSVLKWSISLPMYRSICPKKKKMCAIIFGKNERRWSMSPSLWAEYDDKKDKFERMKEWNVWKNWVQE